jgi:hypothetical protein
LPATCIYIFRVFFTINSSCVHEQHSFLTFKNRASYI